MADRFMKLADFARHIGKSRQYVGKLKDTGRLVLTQDGRVKVAQSLEMIEATKGMRDDVAARHSAARQDAKQHAAVADISPGGKNAPEAAAQVLLAGGLTIKEMAARTTHAKMLDMEAASQIRQMEAARQAGDLIAREDVDAAMKFIGATVRALLDVFPDQVAPVVTPVSDMAEVHALLTEQCRSVLHGLGDAIERQHATLDGDAA